MSLSGNVFKLSNGNTIPAVAYGIGSRWFKGPAPSDVDENLVDAIAKAIKLGFTHLDGAEVYGNDAELGLALKKSGAKREDLFITHKFFSGDKKYTAKSAFGTPDKALQKTLELLGTKYVDLYLLHSPHIKKETHGFTLVEAWNYLETLYDQGLVKNIGVSNFGVEHLQQILDSKPKYIPVVNQIEYSAYLQDVLPGVVEFGKKHGILTESYGGLSPIGVAAPGPIDEEISRLEAKYNKTNTQILLRWILQKGVLPVTTSGNDERIKQILNIFDFELTDEEVAALTGHGKRKHFRKFNSL